jgi:hypothetical protein
VLFRPSRAVSFPTELPTEHHQSVARHSGADRFSACDTMRATNPSIEHRGGSQIPLSARRHLAGCHRGGTPGYLRSVGIGPAAFVGRSADRSAASTSRRFASASLPSVARVRWCAGCRWSWRPGLPQPAASGCAGRILTFSATGASSSTSHATRSRRQSLWANRRSRSVHATATSQTTASSNASARELSSPRDR